jgi:LPXTG-motif cell wall-anchored protein
MKVIGSIALFLGFALISATGFQTQAGAMIGASQLDTASKLSWNEVIGLFLLIVGVALVLFKRKKESQLGKE